MDEISASLLSALAGDMGTRLSSALWTQLRTILNSPLRQRHRRGRQPALQSGLEELDALRRAPSDQDRAEALRSVLTHRASYDPTFRAALDGWRIRALETAFRGRSQTDAAERPLQIIATNVTLHYH